MNVPRIVIPHLIWHPEHVEDNGFLFPDRLGHRSRRDDYQTQDLTFYEFIFPAYLVAIDVPIL
jgi:hypothetical protein